MSEDYKLKVPIQVRFRDTDAMGHVNNAVFLTYLEYARVAYWRAAAFARGHKDIDFILARAEVDYRSPILLSDEVEVWIRVSALRRSSFDFAYRIVEAKTGKLKAEAMTVQACYDYAKNKVKRMEPELRRALAEFENDPELLSFKDLVRDADEGGAG